MKISLVINNRIVRILANASTFNAGYGHIMRAVNVLGAPNDEDALTEKATGKIKILKGNLLEGINTKFTDLDVGTPIFLESGAEFTIKNIRSDT